MQSSIKSSLLNRLALAAKTQFVLWLPKNWHAFNLCHLILLPLSWLFQAIVLCRKYLYKTGVLKSVALPVPVIIVGNINVGGTGKTPLVIYLVEALRAIGLNPGVISRGYGAKSSGVRAVVENDDPVQVGDEPLLIRRRLGCPVYVHANRVLAGQTLLAENPDCDIIISDDGLQHLRLQRNYEIVVFDANNGFGNTALLPAGPLRESLKRLKTVDAIVTNGEYGGAQIFSRWYGHKVFEMQMEAGHFYSLQNMCVSCEAGDFSTKKIFAIAGIGNPDRFFLQLERLGLRFKRRSFPDHHQFVEADFDKIRAEVILMTEKDAVKCQSFAKPNFWVLPVSAVLDEAFILRLFEKLESM